MQSHIGNASTKPGAAAQKAARNKNDKYARLSNTHIFYPFAMETSGTWHDTAIELKGGFDADRLGHGKINLPNKFEVPIFTRYGNIKCVAKCRQELIMEMRYPNVT